jgi:hypothetical protein
MTSHIATLWTPYSTPLPAPAGSLPSDQAVKDWLIRDVAKSCLTEFAVSLTFTSVTTLFVTTATGVTTLVVLALGVTVLNALVKSIAAYLQYRCFQLQRVHTPEAVDQREKLQDLTEYFNTLAPMNFTFLDTTTRNVLVHEGGHALAANLVYKGANPRVEVFPLEGGVTSYYPRLLSNFGKYLDWKNADLFVSAAGTGSAVLFAAGSLVVASHIRETHPQLHRYLVALSIVSVLQHAMYAISALWAPSKSLGHDFVALWRHGIHPIVSAITIMAVPMLSLAAFGKASRPAQQSTTSQV